MQGQRASLGSLPEALNFEHGSTSSNAVIDQQILWNDNIHDLDVREQQDFMIRPDDANLTICNSVYHDQRDFGRLIQDEASSSGTKNEVSSHDEHERQNNGVDLSPLFVQSSHSNRAARNLNLNSDFIGHGDNTNRVGGHLGVYESSRPRNEGVSPTMVFEDSSGRPGSSSLEDRRSSCKRKALEGNSSQPSSSSGGFQLRESGSWTAAPAYFNPGNSLNLPGSREQDPRGLTPGSISDFPLPVIAESSHRNFRVRTNPPGQLEALNPGMFSAGSVVRRPAPPILPLPSRVLPLDQNPLDLRPGPALGNAVFQNQSGSSATHIPTIPRNVQPSQWNSGSAFLAGGSSSYAASAQGDAVPRSDIRSRNILDNPFLIPASESRNLAHNPTNRNLTVGNLSIHGNVRSLPSRAGSSTQSNPTWAPPNQSTNAQHYHRRFNELVRRSLLSSRASEPGHQRGRDPPTLRSSVSLVPPLEALPPYGGGSNSQAHGQYYHRISSWPEREGDSVIGVPRSLRVLASANRGRNRLVASEIRNILDLLRRGENLRIEDVMLLDQSVLVAAADVHDQYRDMRLDVDNMSYEELLALGERIGDVCTGLSEGTISNRLKQRKHMCNIGTRQDAEPCCICQEEYEDGEELGTLDCGHEFHSGCIKQWLNRKNLCPICKTTGLNTTQKPVGSSPAPEL